MGKGQGKGQGKGECGCDGGDNKDLLPDHPRYCQDILWTIVFLAFCVGIVVIMSFAFDEGEPERILNGHDSFGNICGESNRKRIDNINSGIDMNSRGDNYILASGLVLCIERCPDDETNIAWNDAGIFFCSDNVQSCIDAGLCLTAPYNATNNTDVEQPSGCPDFVYKSKEIPFLNRCLPKVISDISSEAKDILEEYAKVVNAQEQLDTFATSFINAARVFGALVVVAVIISFTFIALMRCCAGPLVYLTILVCSVALIAATGILAYLTINGWADYNDKPDSEQLESEERNLQVLTGTLVFVAVFTLIFLCVVCAMRKAIYTAVQIFEEASKALFHMPSVFCVPVCSLVSIVAWLVVFAVIMAYVATANDHETDDKGYVEYKISERQEVMFAYMIFALYWITQLFLAMEEFIVASSVVIWYLHQGKFKGWELGESAWRLFRYHFGSIALGSFIVALVQFARTIVEYVEYKTKEAGQDSCIVKYIFYCLRCCLYCLEKCVKFINKNAYIEIAIWGDSFCVSCCHALSIITSHLSLVASINGVGFLLCFVMKVATMACVGFFAYLWLEEEDDIEQKGAVAIFAMFFAYVIADAFCDVYDMSAEALLICFLEDYKYNSDIGMLAPDDLKKLMAKKGDFDQRQSTKKTNV